ncbi:hypothetical protein SSP531S_11200 [Streptomyces spongiicola]|uniref:Uncharacterized protein n=1 Tax=Streptomyces spongiicola TaxID=1690221 RepID=A0A388SUF1_9ACTN|nr:hypothetical protein SSP531S_11200 [Streptomyces spongiicola]
MTGSGLVSPSPPVSAVSAVSRGLPPSPPSPPVDAPGVRPGTAPLRPKSGRQDARVLVVPAGSSVSVSASAAAVTGMA